ncbi:MAG: hypothetical protein K2Q14_02450 [Gammaproteobacteria bacterium]|nr:hypothetical protein [Gammaproteobacteria bacterium]
MQKESFKKYLPVLLVGLILVAVNVFALVWYLVPNGPDQWNADVVPGKVVLISETSIVTRDPRGNTKTFVITPETKILAGKKIVTTQFLPPGTMVLIEKDLSTTSDVVAKEIRVITDKRKEKITPTP